jgi:hypothetical protein
MGAGRASLDAEVESVELKRTSEIGAGSTRVERPRSEASELVCWATSWSSGLSSRIVCVIIYYGISKRVVV